MTLLYNDEGVGQHMLHCLKKYLRHHGVSYLEVNSEFIINESMSNYSSLIIGGGEDLPYCKRLNGKGNQNIQEFVSGGGSYVGICAGAYYASRAIEFHGNDYDVEQERELALFEGIAKGSLPELCGGAFFSASTESKSVISIDIDEYKFESYYHGGCTFTGVTRSQIVGSYFNDNPAIIAGSYGRGRYLLSGVHFEVNQHAYEDYLLNNNLSISIAERKLISSLPITYDNHFWEQLSPYL